MKRMVGMMRGAAVAALVIALTGGCASIQDQRGYLVDAALVDSVQAGVDNKTSVERALGRPTFASQFGDPAWYYVSMTTRQRPFSRPSTTQQQVMRVRFDAAGNVIGVDRRAMEQVVRLDPDGDKTPTLGRDRGFLQDLFGNIGSVGAPGAGGGGAGPGGGPNGS